MKNSKGNDVAEWLVKLIARTSELTLWTSYATQDRIEFLHEQGYSLPAAEEYAFRDFDSLPFKVRTSILNWHKHN